MYKMKSVLKTNTRILEILGFKILKQEFLCRVRQSGGIVSRSHGFQATWVQSPSSTRLFLPNCISIEDVVFEMMDFIVFRLNVMEIHNNSAFSSTNTELV